jgi:S-adenosylmethionine-diacylgycerolhomoserine-N-methlytransferase
MSRYYAWQSRVYDATRWAFLFGRDAILDELDLRSGDTVVEVGCGTGRNFEGVLRRIGPSGNLIAVDCSQPMLRRCRSRIQKNAWRNVLLEDQEYGARRVTGGQADVVLLSYSLSMIPDWGEVLCRAREELRPGGRIGVVDFCMDSQAWSARVFARWMAHNHVTLDRPSRERLSALFRPLQCFTRPAFGGLWSYYRFVGERA